MFKRNELFHNMVRCDSYDDMMYMYHMVWCWYGMIVSWYLDMSVGMVQCTKYSIVV